MGIVYGLLGLLAITTSGLITFALFERKANRELLAMRDLREKQDEAFDALEVDRNGFKVELDGAREELRKEQDRRATAESERNDAVRMARDFYVSAINASTNVADKVRLVDELLSLPLPVGVSEELPAGDPTRTDDDLLKPAGMSVTTDADDDGA